MSARIDRDYDVRVLRAAEDFARAYGCAYATAEAVVLRACLNLEQ